MSTNFTAKDDDDLDYIENLGSTTLRTAKVTPKPRISFKASAKYILSYNDLGLFLMAVIFTVLCSLIVSFSAKRSVSGYYFVNKNIGFFPIACSMIMANIGSAHFVGIAALSSRIGLAGYAYELNSTLVFIVLGWVFLPVYIASGSVTTIDYLKKRYGGRRIEFYVSVLSLSLVVFTKISVELYSLYKILEIFFLNPDPRLISSPFLLWAVLVTCSGGLRAVVYTSTALFFIVLVGGGFISYYCVTAFESFDLLKDKFFQSWPNTTKITFGQSSSNNYTFCGIPQPSSWNIIREYNSNDVPWPGMVFGITISAIWYFCCDQMIVQSALGASSIVHAKSACIIAGYVKMLTILFLVMPGIVARIFYTDEVACADPGVCQNVCQSKYGCTTLAFPLLFLQIVPQNYRGVVLATVLLCGVTSLTASLNSGGTIFAFNVYKNIRGNVSAMELMIVTKLAVMVLAIFSMSALSVIQTTPSVTIYVQEVTSTLAPPIAAVYLCGLFWDRTTEMAAFRSLLLGLCLGLFRLIWHSSLGNVVCGEENQAKVPHILSRFHFLHFGIFLFVICVSYMIISGIFSEPIGLVHLYRLTFWLRYSKLDRVDIDELDKAYDKLLNKRTSETQDSETSSVMEPNAFRFPILGNLCCLETDTASHIITNNELREMVKPNANIGEPERYSKALNLHAILMLLLSALLWGYLS
ncbi:sodium/glucose cotransporter 1-like [Biomphalaria glabrata]|uniref:Sodium/glucose cotransporter 1-like n=2 Tax=Biomphalaria glabrata TaxID=6526 RepID=A0A9W2YKP3_BIOGL|nr:sodium/glucose cotransporter 1-like [Biomphalaria glabrata]